jgi:hypothetical protein
LLLLVLAPAALAAPLEAKIGRKPFVPVAVLAGPAPTRPGQMWVTLSDAPLTCDTLGQRPSEGARAVTIEFPDTRPGTVSTGVYGTTADLRGSATLLSVPSAAGERGRVSLALRGRRARLGGEAEFVLCEPIAQIP